MSMVQVRDEQGSGYMEEYRFKVEMSMVQVRDEQGSGYVEEQGSRQK